MAENLKIIKARCKKTNRYYSLLAEQLEDGWQIVNMMDLKKNLPDGDFSVLEQKRIVTNEALLACIHCGNRTVGGCSCAKKIRECSPDMKYRFDCIYCDEFEVLPTTKNADKAFADKSLDGKNSSATDTDGSGDKTENKATQCIPEELSPYNECAGVNDIASLKKDAYGNPLGSEYDLAKDGGFSGYKILVLNLCDECDFAKPQQALIKKGFEVIECKVPPEPAVLKALLYSGKTQLWVISHKYPFLQEEHIKIIYDYFDSGHGVYIFGDSDPYFADANALLDALFSAEMKGNFKGDCLLSLKTQNNTAGIEPKHLLTTGIVNFYEGITIAEIDVRDSLSALVCGSELQATVAYYANEDKRAIADGGFTRLYFKWDTAGSERFIVNAAAWLANYEFFEGKAKIN